MPVRQVLSVTGDVALQLLRLTAASSDVFPPLKSAASGALHIVELVQGFHSSQEEWRALGTYVGNTTASVVHSLTQVDGLRKTTKQNLETLERFLKDIEDIVQKERAAPWYKRAVSSLQDPDKTADLKARLNDAIGLFHLSATTSQMIDVENVLTQVIENGKSLSNIEKNTTAMAVEIKTLAYEGSKQALAMALNKLTRASGASWDSNRVCMSDTRVVLLDNIEKWSKNGGGPTGAHIMLLTAVAGAGKSTLAHTVAKRSANGGILGSSFFFDRNITGRDSPVLLFTTMAADLGGRYPKVGEYIAQAIEADPSLPSAPIARQFDSLILGPCQMASFTEPIVIVVDGLDEAWDEVVLDILRHKVPLLPPALRLFVTCRMRPELEPLWDMTHVRWIQLDVSGKENMQDMAIYAPSRLRQLAMGRKVLGEDWPGEELRRRFIELAGGLFLWVDVVCGYLQRRSDMTSELEKLMSIAGTLTSTAEAQMDRLYATILDSFDWTDGNFVADYKRVMGMVVVSRTPLSMAAMQELHDPQLVATEFTLQQLGSLLAGTTKMDDPTVPVQMLHQSLREFVVDRANSSKDWHKFAINVGEYSRTLGLLSLRLVNRELHEGMPGTGYLFADEDMTLGIPRIRKGAISPGLAYACLFWPDHLDGTSWGHEVTEQIRELTKHKAVLWLEVTASLDHCRRLSTVLIRTEEGQMSTDAENQRAMDIENSATACILLSDRLTYEDRREEALEMAEEALQFRQQLAASRSTGVVPDLAASLHKLSLCLSGVWRHEDALAAAEQSVGMRRLLANEKPSEFTPHLASSLHNLSTCLYHLKRQNEALAAIEEAVILRQGLDKDHPGIYTSDLAASLNNLSYYLSDAELHEKALVTVERAVDVYRKLASEQPTVFTAQLARSLNTQSVCLSSLKRHEDALSAIKESVNLGQNPTVGGATVSLPQLAGSLNNLSNCLSNTGRHEGALEAVEQATDIYKQLTVYRPAVFNPELARPFCNMSHCLFNLESFKDTLGAIEQAADLYRRLAADYPTTFQSDLVACLKDMLQCLFKLRYSQEATAVENEIIGLRPELARTLLLPVDREMCYEAKWSRDLAVSVLWEGYPGWLS